MPKTGTYYTLDFSLSPEDRVRSIWNDLADDPEYMGFDTVLMRNIKLISASIDPESGYGKTEFEVTIPPSLCNKTGVLHGGAACTMLDNLTSTPLQCMAKPGFLDNGHVSRTIAMSYLRPVPAGATVKVACTAMAVGKVTANVVGVMRTLDGKVCVTCVHDKAVFTERRFPSKL